MRMLILPALIATLTQAQAAGIGPYIVYDSKGHVVGGIESNEAIIRQVNGHLYSINETIEQGFLGYDFLYTSTDCTGQPYVEDVNQYSVWPAQVYVGPAANGTPGEIYGPIPGPNGLAVTTQVAINSQSYNWGSLTRYCSPAGNGSIFSVSPVYPIQNVIGLTPPFFAVSLF